VACCYLSKGVTKKDYGIRSTTVSPSLFYSGLGSRSWGLYRCTPVVPLFIERKEERRPGKYQAADYPFWGLLLEGGEEWGGGCS